MPDKPESSSPPWHGAELSPDDAEYLRGKLDQVPNLATVLSEMGEDLTTEGSSRTVFCPPINRGPMDAPSSMRAAAADVASIVWREGLDGLERAPLEVRIDEVPEQLGELSSPEGLKGTLDPTEPIGYVRVALTETGPQASVGCLDPQTRAHYSMAL